MTNLDSILKSRDITLPTKVLTELPVQVQCRIQDAWGWCTGMNQRDGTGREVGGGFRMGREVGGGFRMGNTYTPVADSC